MKENELFGAVVSLSSRLRTLLRTVWIIPINCIDFSRELKALSQTGCEKVFRHIKSLILG